MLTSVRMFHAAKYLRETKFKNAEIGARIRIPDERYFGQVFKKKYGMPPYEFRKSKEEIRLMRNWIFLILACICGLAVFLFFIISKSITRPIRNLSRMIEDVGHGNFEVNCMVEGEDEIAMLS